MMKENVNDNWLGTCRGIAVCGVLLTHFIPYIEMYYQINLPVASAITVGIIDTGKVGIAILFLIAGYLAPSSKKKRSTGQFVVNRFFRLYPLYWLDIILVGCLFAFDQYGISTVLANVTMLQVFLGCEDLVGLFWTLPIELLLYAGAVFFERFMWDERKLLSLLTVSSVGTVCIAIIRKAVWTSAPVAIGLLLSIALLGHLFRLYKNGTLQKQSIKIGIFIFEICLIITCVLAYQVDMGHQENWYRYFFSYSLAVMIFAGFMLTSKSIKIFNQIAVIAYPLYLLQEIVFRVAFELIWKASINPVMFSSLIVLVLLMCSIFAHYLIEIPMSKLGNAVEICMQKERNF